MLLSQFLEYWKLDMRMLEGDPKPPAKKERLTDNCEFDGYIWARRRRSGEIKLGSETATLVEVGGAGIEWTQNHIVDQIRLV